MTRFFLFFAFLSILPFHVHAESGPTPSDSAPQKKEIDQKILKSSVPEPATIPEKVLPKEENKVEEKPKKLPRDAITGKKIEPKQAPQKKEKLRDTVRSKFKDKKNPAN